MCKATRFLIIAICVFYSICKSDTVGFWGFDAIDTGIIDYSGLENHGGAVGEPIYSSNAVLGQGSIFLDGNSYITLFDSREFEADFSAGQVSLVMWVKLDESVQDPINKGLVSIGSWAYPSFYPGSSEGVISLKAFLSEGQKIEVQLPDDFDIHNWNHLAITVDADDTQAGYRVYLNGELAASFPMNGTYGNFLPPHTPRIGMTFDLATSTAYYFNGNIDEVMIYNRSLSAIEVLSIAKIADLTVDGAVDFADFAYIADKWFSNCQAADWCDGADFNRDGYVDIADLAVFVSNWLR